MPEQYKKIFIPVFIVAIALTVRIWNIWNVDVQGDLAINSFRALGWFDYLSDTGQTSPVNWYDEQPWWAYLSFQDHPYLVFLIAFLFFQLFGDATLIVYLPYILAGVGTTALLYFLVNSMRGQKEALIVSGLYAATSYAVWASRTGYLEGIQVFFIVASFAAFAWYIHSRKSYMLLMWGIATGLAIMSKYTSAFLLVAAAAYILIWDRALLRSKMFWAALLLMILVCIPTIIYNGYVFSERGHFDAALSSMLGMASDDFETVATRKPSFSFANSLTLLTTLRENISLPFAIALLLGIGLYALRMMRTSNTPYDTLLMLHGLALLLMFQFLSSGARFVSILLPFLFLTAGSGFMYAWKTPQPKWRWLFASLGVLVLVAEGAYMVNTNLLTKPWGMPRVTHAAERFHDMGFEKLNSVLRRTAYPTLPSRQDPRHPGDLNFENKITVLVDERTNWFSLIWYIRRYLFYYNLPVLTLQDVDDSIQQVAGAPANLFEFLKFWGAREVLYVYTVVPMSERFAPDYILLADGIREILEKQTITPMIIQDAEGRDRFYLYRFDISNLSSNS